MTVPDYVAPFAGWKAFSVSGDRRGAFLREPGPEGEVWWPGEVHSESNGDRIPLLGTTPQTLAAVRDAGVNGSGRLCVGIVNGWGDVTLTGALLHVERAYPRALWLPFDDARRRDRREAIRLHRRLADYGVATTAIPHEQWMNAFNQASVDAEGGHAVAETDANGEGRFVVEPVISPVPAKSRRRRASEPCDAPHRRGLDGRTDAADPEHMRRRPRDDE
jgi:hypothetical protein